MPDHVCACKACDPSLNPQGERRGEHHFAVRFGDHLHVIPYLDGVKLNHCYEADVARDTVWVYREPLHVCRCSIRDAEACAEIRHGKVRIHATLTLPGR